ncbi:hypothetical protein CMUS01_16275 [Colletotrichum musicola]|uniref:Fungal N-terminal domain-containing protein n=1 Tax=Colletotrichum musicola TaxID=2175873 RepID=A0A8H6IQ65_9PEZI|nr:hypothetical protein CMUS01_16275 [Colletotrichum musicola]
MEVAIGVIGLSLQLIDSAVKIKGVIGTYHSASTEANRLALKVELIEAICNTITKSFGQDDSDCQSPELFGTLGARLIGSIQCTLDELHSIVSRLEKRASKDRALKTTGVFFLSKRDDIARLSKCLDEELSHLQLLLTASLALTSTVSSRLLLAPQAETQLGSSTSNLNSTALASSFEVESSPKLFMATSVQKTCRQIIRVFGFHGQSQTVSTTKRSRWGDSQETTSTSETRSFALGHSRLSYRVEIDFLWTPLNSISYALNIRHIIADTNVENGMYRNLHQLILLGDHSQLQSLLSARKINLSSLVGPVTLFEVTPELGF